MRDYQKELNAAQLQAVQSTEGPHLVIAGAGSGKTRVLVYRVAYLVEKGVDPSQILLLTFTRRAAEEMLRRASLLLDDRCRKVSGGTFHSFAHLALRRYAPALGLARNFTILDESDMQDALNLVRMQMGFHKQLKRFPRKHALAEIISKSANICVEISKVLYNEYPQFIEWESDIQKLRDEYVRYKQAKSLLDYDDLLIYLKDLLSEHDAIRKAISEKYRYIMVDEYQDTNKLQAYITCLLGSWHKNVMVVGDDSQSIYSFRGADFKNIIGFPEIFKETRIITLEENYRSAQPILDLTNEIISRARDKFEKRLFTRKPGSALPVFVDAANEHAQSRYVADKILELREDGIELGDIAVLFRSGWHSNDLEIELAARDIPFVKYGGQKFVEAAHIKDILSYARIVYNPFDEISWHRALLLMRGIGQKKAEAVIRQVIGGKQGINFNDNSLMKIEDLAQLIELLRGADIASLGPAEIISRFLQYYQPLLQEKYDDFPKRLNDLDSLINIASRYKSLEVFLSDVALEPPERSIIERGARDKDDSRLVLSTIHSAKGLEWHTVFIIYAAEGHLPSYLSLEDEDAIEEERRLLYVAATRAKENLLLLKPHIDRSSRSYFAGAGRVFTQVSRFLDEEGILGRFCRIESAQGEYMSDDGKDALTRAGAGGDEKFLELMKEYFRGID